MQRRVSRTRADKTPKVEKLELVHTDVWGPTLVKSIGNLRYYVTFIDESTWKVWIYFLKNKSDLFFVFKRWKTEIENQTGLRLKVWNLTMVGSIILKSLRISVQNMGSELLRQYQEHLSKMVLQKGLIEPWMREWGVCGSNLACLRHSGQKN